MKRILIGLVGLFFATSAALAQTAAPLPTKAPSGPMYPTGFGYYAGIGTAMEMASSTIAVNGTNTNLNSVGAAFAAVAGVQYKLPGKNLGFTEVGVSYANLGSAATCGGVPGVGVACSINGPWTFEITTAIGFDWTLPATALGNVWQQFFGGGSPAQLLPPGLVPTSIFPYIGVSGLINEVNAAVPRASTQTWQAMPALDIGFQNYLANGGMVDVRFEYGFGDASFNVTPGVTAKPGNLLRSVVLYKF